MSPESTEEKKPELVPMIEEDIDIVKPQTELEFSSICVNC